MSRRTLTAGEIGRKGEEAVSEWLTSHGITNLLNWPLAPFDIDCSGIRIEVKTSNPRYNACSRYPSWSFNVHWHQEINTQCHFYIFRMHKVPGQGTIHLVVPAPLNQLVVALTEQSLFTKWLPYKDNLGLLRDVIAAKTAA